MPLLRNMLTYYSENDVDVIIVNQVPQQRLIPGLLVQDAMMLGLSDEEAWTLFESTYVSQEESNALQTGAREASARLAEEFGVRVVTFDELFVEGDQFAWIKGDTSLYMDDDHVSANGSRLMTSAFRALLE